MITLHDGVQGRDAVCHWQQTLKPLSFGCERIKELRDFVVVKIHHGVPLGAHADPFPEWLTRIGSGKESEKGYNNVLQVLSRFITERGMPKTFGIYPPVLRDLCTS
jgi:hypothetical protein